MAPTSDQWGQCPAGAVQDLTGRLRARQHRRQLRHVAAASGTLALLALVGWSLLPGRSPIGAEIPCHQVRPRLAAYHAAELPEVERKRISDHLRHCPGCARHAQELLEGRVPEASSGGDADAMPNGDSAPTQIAAAFP